MKGNEVSSLNKFLLVLKLNTLFSISNYLVDLDESDIFLSPPIIIISSELMGIANELEILLGIWILRGVHILSWELNHSMELKNSFEAPRPPNT